MKIGVFTLLLTLAGIGVASAQLPPDAVSLKRVKIKESLSSIDLCPVHGVPSDPSVASWTHAGIEYRGDAATCQEEFEKDPDGYAASAAWERYVQNFMAAMSTIWCPVTDEVSPGGLTQWDKLGYTWESCCDFCDDSVQDEDFDSALELLRARAEKAYVETGGRYFPDASSPIEGAIDFGNGFPDEAESDEIEVADAGETPATSPPPALPEAAAWMNGQELKATYAEGIGQLFEQRCVECHRPGGAAPMSFTSYGGIRSWIKSMKQSVESRGMPPWPADPNVVAYENSRYLTPAEMELFLEWANNGFPKGEGDFTSSAPEGEWSIGEPDHVFEAPEYTLGEDETSAVKEFDIVNDLGEDRWVAAAQAVAGDIYTITDIQAGPLGSFYPGSSPDVYPASAPRLLKAGETITVSIGNAKEAGYELPVGPSKLGVAFADTPPTGHGAQVDPLSNTGFTVPAGAEDFTAEATFEFTSDGWIHSFRPVLNQRGKSVSLTAELPDGTVQPLLSIPRWDPAWKMRYRLAAPFRAPAGTIVRLTGTYDNSKLNAKNPDASVDVSAGPGGEALEGWLVYSLD